MDPITIFGIAIGIEALVFFVLGTVVSIAIVVISANFGAIVKFRYQHLPTKEVGIFGASCHGKSSLIDFLSHKPFVGSHNPTRGIDVKKKLLGSKTTDIEGDSATFYQDVIDKYNPEGIIFLVDPQRDIVEAETALKYLENAYRNKYIRIQGVRTIRLKVFLILLSKADEWCQQNNNQQLVINDEKTRILNSLTSQRFFTLINNQLQPKSALDVQVGVASFKESAKQLYAAMLKQALDGFKGSLYR